MALRKISFFICLLLSMACLAAGYAVTGKWAGSVIAILTSLAWLPARKNPASGLPAVCLFLSACVALAGVLATGSSAVWMICGSGFALATWDLVFLEDALRGGLSDGQTRRYENSHLRSLAQALACGLIVALIGRQLNFEIPFVVMLLCVALLIFGFERFWHSLPKRTRHIP